MMHSMKFIPMVIGRSTTCYKGLPADAAAAFEVAIESVRAPKKWTGTSRQRETGGSTSLALGASPLLLAIFL